MSYENEPNSNPPTAGGYDHDFEDNFPGLSYRPPRRSGYESDSDDDDDVSDEEFVPAHVTANEVPAKPRHRNRIQKLGAAVSNKFLSAAKAASKRKKPEVVDLVSSSSEDDNDSVLHHRSKRIKFASKRFASYAKKSRKGRMIEKPNNKAKKAPPGSKRLTSSAGNRGKGQATEKPNDTTKKAPPRSRVFSATNNIKGRSYRKSSHGETSHDYPPESLEYDLPEDRICRISKDIKQPRYVNKKSHGYKTKMAARVVRTDLLVDTIVVMDPGETTKETFAGSGRRLGGRNLREPPSPRRPSRGPPPPGGGGGGSGGSGGGSGGGGSGGGGSGGGGGGGGGGGVPRVDEPAGQNVGWRDDGGRCLDIDPARNDKTIWEIADVERVMMNELDPVICPNATTMDVDRMTTKQKVLYQGLEVICYVYNWGMVPVLLGNTPAAKQRGSSPQFEERYNRTVMWCIAAVMYIIAIDGDSLLYEFRSDSSLNELIANQRDGDTTMTERIDAMWEIIDRVMPLPKRFFKKKDILNMNLYKNNGDAKRRFFRFGCFHQNYLDIGGHFNHPEQLKGLYFHHAKARSHLTPWFIHNESNNREAVFYTAMDCVDEMEEREDEVWREFMDPDATYDTFHEYH